MFPDSAKKNLEDLKGEFSLRIDDITTADITYIGKSRPGSLTSAAAWQIRKMDESSGVSITWADGDTLYNNIWDNRQSLSYS